MNKKILLSGLLITLIVFSGCVKIAIKEDIKENGMSDMSIVMDRSAIPEDSESGLESPVNENPCDNMTAQVEGDDASLPLSNISCSYEDKILTLSGRLDRSNSEAFTIGEGTFKIDVKKALESINESESAEQLPEDPQQMAQLKMMGFEYSYSVKLPGTLVKQEDGEV